jgi:hypothetical protein
MDLGAASEAHPAHAPIIAQKLSKISIRCRINKQSGYAGENLPADSFRGLAVRPAQEIALRPSLRAGEIHIFDAVAAFGDFFGRDTNHA